VIENAHYGTLDRRLESADPHYDNSFVSCVLFTWTVRCISIGPPCTLLFIADLVEYA
jgi:hypothetical protein